MRFLLFLLTSLLLAIAVQSCKKECHDHTNPKCENYNPCFGKFPALADFTISEVVSGFPNETEEVFRMSYVQFSAKQEFESYQWVIGNHNDTFYTRTCGLKDFPEGETITVRLVGKRKPNTDCFPNDDGIDTVYKTFKVTAGDSLMPIVGEYEGYYEGNPNKKVTVKVLCTKKLDGQNIEYWDFSIQNIPVESVMELSDGITLGSSVWRIRSGDDGPVGGYRMEGYIYLLPDKKTLVATYNHWDTASHYPNFVRINGGFRGTRK